MTVCVDASAVVSLFDENDPNHKRAKKLASKLVSVERIVSNFVFAEIVTILSQKIGKQASIDAGNYLNHEFTMIRLDPEIENSAWEIFKKQTSKNVSFVDCTIIALYKDGAFDKVFTFDTDFKKNKVAVLE